MDVTVFVHDDGFLELADRNHWSPRRLNVKSMATIGPEFLS